jgi:hypothetical protein
VLCAWIVPDNPDLSAYGHTYRYTGDAKIALPRDHYRYIRLARSRDHGATWDEASWR